MRGEAGEILRRHVLARRQRGSLRGVAPDAEPTSRGSAPKLDREFSFARSCQLVKGVPETTLLLLEEWFCGTAGSTWTVDAVRIGTKLHNIPKEQVALRLTLAEAAENLGWKLTYKQCKALIAEAQSIVLDNLIERAGREVDDSYER